MKNERLKTCFSYHGGKQRLVAAGLGAWLRRNSGGAYHEAFTGGGAVLANILNQPLPTMSANELHPRVAAAWRGIARSPSEVTKRVMAVLNHEDMRHEVKRFQHSVANGGSDVDCAAAQLLACTNFNSRYGNYGYPEMRGKALRKLELLPRLSRLLQGVTLREGDAMAYIAGLRGGIVYCDPPYLETDCGQYAGGQDGWQRHHLDLLVRLCKEHDGKACISHVWNESFQQATDGMHIIGRPLHRTKGKGGTRLEIEAVACTWTPGELPGNGWVHVPADADDAWLIKRAHGHRGDQLGFGW